MMHKIISAVSKDDFSIETEFMGGEVKKYSLDDLLIRFPQFQKLKEDRKLFEAVKVDAGGYGVSWNDELDVDAYTIWEQGILIEVQKKEGMDINRLLAYRLALAREKAGMTQKQLAEKTGIYQADISKIERGLANPSLSTLKRLADGLNMGLVVDFVSLDEQAV